MKLLSIHKALLLAFLVLFLASFASQTANAEDLFEKNSVTPQNCLFEQNQSIEVNEDLLVAQNDPCPGKHTCITYSCGGDSNTSVCCPRGFPYLSHCDCKCYEASPNCASYTRCNIP